MAKILKTADIRFKLREKELLEMDKDNQMLDETEQEEKAVKKIKEMTKKDAFFTMADEEDKPAIIEKKVVQRNGWIVDPN